MAFFADFFAFDQAETSETGGGILEFTAGCNAGKSSRAFDDESVTVFFAAVVDVVVELLVVLCD